MERCIFTEMAANMNPCDLCQGKAEEGGDEASLTDGMGHWRKEQALNLLEFPKAAIVKA